METTGEKAESRASRIAGIVFFALLAGACLMGLRQGARQFATSGYPSVPGTITRYNWEDAGDAGRILSVSYRYRIGALEYRGDRIRHLFRPLRIGGEQARARALTWRGGRHVAVFYDPANPSVSLLDKGLTTGDWIFLAATAAMLCASAGGVFYHVRRLFKSN